MSHALIILLGLIVLLLIQAKRVGFNAMMQKLCFPDRGLRADIVLSLIWILGLGPFLMAVFSLGLSLFIGPALVASVNMFPIHRLTGNTIADAACYLSVRTFVDYWNHRFAHTRIGWPLHRFHHSAETFSPLVGYRTHPLHNVALQLTNVAPVVFLGFAPMTVIVIELGYELYTAMIHLDVDWHFGRLGRWIVSPAGHRLHHSRLTEHLNKNFGVVTMFWDHVFGTFYEGTTPVAAVGIPEQIHNRAGLLRDLLTDARDFLTIRF